MVEEILIQNIKPWRWYIVVGVIMLLLMLIWISIIGIRNYIRRSVRRA